MSNTQHRKPSGNEWILWVLMAACVAISSVAFVAFKAHTSETIIAVVIWAVSAAILCLVVRQIWIQLDGFRGKKGDDLLPKLRPADKEPPVVVHNHINNNILNRTEPRISVFPAPVDVVVQERKDSDIADKPNVTPETAPVFESKSDIERHRYEEMVKAVPEQTVKSLPPLLRSDNAIFLLLLFREDGYLDEGFIPTKTGADGEMNQTIYAFLADGISKALLINNKWKTFAEFWQLPNGAQTLTNLSKYTRTYGTQDWQRQIAKTLRKATRLRPSLESESLDSFTRQF